LPDRRPAIGQITRRVKNFLNAMKARQAQPLWNARGTSREIGPGGPLADRLLSLVDAGLIATICVAPYVFGGRHDMGRLVFVALVGLTAVAWFVRQSLLPNATWTRTAAHAVFLCAVALVAFQLVPLPDDWLAWLSPRTRELLPLWSGGDAAAQLGVWNTISLTPRETTLALAMLVSYGLWFIVLSQRLQTTADVEWLLNVVAIAAVLMAAFGLLQYFTSNGEFFWCYVHPYRTTDNYAMGSFMNRNHFADFLVLGIGPLVRWLVSTLRAQGSGGGRKHAHANSADLIRTGLLAASIALVLLGIALSMSKGGAIAATAATVTIGAVYLRWRLVDGKYFVGLAGVGLLLVGLLSIHGYDKVTKRLDTLASGSVEAVDQDEGRRKVWTANLHAIEQGGLTGSGAGSHREICPVYLEEPTTLEYTHAENGYLQVATENGAIGVVLLAAGIGLGAIWCLLCLARLQNTAQQLCFGAAAAGLVASLVHSLVDFVWYIPACLSVTLALAVCVLRLAQLSLGDAERSRARREFSWMSWLECAAVASLLGSLTAYAYVRPAVAAIHWDRCCRDNMARNELFANQLSPLAPELTAADAAMRDPLADSIEHHLEQTVYWDPSFARAHLRLAAAYVDRFELAQQSADNAMPLQQIRDAAQSSNFKSTAELRSWLNRAVGANVELLEAAYAHARQAVALSPLEGDGYVLLASLKFLSNENSATTDAYVAQAQRVRPYGGEVMYEVGKHLYTHGHYDQGMHQWSMCFANSGRHQLRIVNLLAGRLPARDFLDAMHPDWHTLREIWARYRQAGRAEDLADLIDYAAKVTERDVHGESGIPAVYIWAWQASLYSDMHQKEQALTCLEHAYQCDQHIFSVRFALGYALKDAGKYSEAEPHLRWCLSRRPENQGLQSAILEITKLRTLQRSSNDVAANSGSAIRDL
jgi:O-antigen ligase/tetratricopeptide (TPR) repeat protein